MKVNANKDSVELSQASRTKHGGKAGKAGAKGGDDTAGASAASTAGATANVELSSEARAMATAGAAAKADDTNEAKIARVKAAINGGTYKPDFGKVADKMLNEHLMQESS